MDILPSGARRWEPSHAVTLWSCGPVLESALILGVERVIATAAPLWMRAPCGAEALDYKSTDVHAARPHERAWPGRSYIKAVNALSYLQLNAFNIQKLGTSKATLQRDQEP